MYQKPQKNSTGIIVTEEIHPREAHDDYSSLKTIINGKRDVGFLELTKEMEPKIIKHNLGVIPVRMTSQKTMMAIIYRDRPKAYKLYEYTKKYNGYLTDRTPIEAREIGRILGYTEQSIEEYIHDKYGRKPPLRTDTPDDYNNMDEQLGLYESKNIQGLNKKIVEVVKDEKGKDVKICTVSGSYVKGTNPGLGFIQFVEGGHHYVDSYPGYKKYIPEDEIWVDEVFYKTPENFHGIVGHEFKERNNMKYHKMSYDKAHDLSNTAEKNFRNKKQKLNENFQFIKIFHLMKKVI
jgi:hypothetical protein